MSVYRYYHHNLAYAEPLHTLRPVSKVNNHLRSTYSLSCCVSVFKQHLCTFRAPLAARGLLLLVINHQNEHCNSIQ